MHRARFVLLAAGGLAMATGVWLGLVRMGIPLPVRELAPMDHGPLMVSGFLGTVIALERAVALRKTWGYLAPLLNALGSLVTLFTASIAGPVLMTLGSGVVLVILLRVLWMDHALHHVILTAAAAAWVVGNALMTAGVPIFDVVGWWIAFLTLTIAAERLELNRLLRPSLFSRAQFIGCVAVLVTGCGLVLVDRDLGFRLVGAACVGLAVWLLANDVARRTVKLPGATRFIAVSLLGGYGWLAVGGALALRFGNPAVGPVYDALLHALLVGFVFSMIFGHALIIVPAVLGVGVQFRLRFYAHLALLHLSLGFRVAGDLASVDVLRTTGAWLNAAAILLFIVNTVMAARRRKAPAARPVGAGAAVSKVIERPA